VVAAVDWTAREVGGLDILVNNAGIAVMARDLGARGIAVNNIDGGFTA
jgi:NADP-dependent 3-hydroxy acid dehydrogenase YdfG